MEDFNESETKAQKEKEEEEEINRGLKEDPITLRSKFL